MDKKTILLNEIYDLVGNLMYYNRKEDENLKIGDIEKMIEYGVVSIDEMTEKFKKEIRDSL